MSTLHDEDLFIPGIWRLRLLPMGTIRMLFALFLFEPILASSSHVPADEQNVPAEEQKEPPTSGAEPVPQSPADRPPRSLTELIEEEDDQAILHYLQRAVEADRGPAERRDLASTTRTTRSAPTQQSRPDNVAADVKDDRSSDDGLSDARASDDRSSDDRLSDDSAFLRRTIDDAQPWVHSLSHGSVSHYPTFAEATALLNSWMERFPDLLKAASVGKSFEGRDLMGYTLRNHSAPAWVAATTDAKEARPPEFLLTGLTHAREPGGLVVILYFMGQILTQHEVDADARYRRGDFSGGRRGYCLL